MNRRDRDAAQMHVLESVLIGLVMVAAVSFVVTFSAPTSQTESTRQRLDAQASDALAVLNEYPLSDARYGNNTLSKMVFECLQQKCTNLTSRLDGLLPNAVAYNVYINNGYAYLPVYEPKLPAGEAVSVRYPLEPRLTYVWMQTATEEVAPNLKTTLGVYALPVWNSNILLDGGAGIEVRVQGINNANQRTFNITAFYSTQQGPNLPAVGVLWYNASGKPTNYIDRTVALGNSSYWLEVKESAGKAVRKGTTLTVTTPRGFTLAEWQGSTDKEWWERAAAGLTGAPEGGQTLVMQLKKDLPANGAVRFRYNATSLVSNNAPDVYDFYSHNVRLGNGAYAIADLVLRFGADATATGGDFHAVAASIPKPMGTTATSRYAVAVQSPVLPNPSETVTITRIEFLQPEGHKVFGSAAAASYAYGGTWTIGAGGASLAWTGLKPMLPNEALTMLVDVTGSGATTPGVPKEHQVASIATPSGSATLTRMVGPGLFYGEIAPRQTVPVALNGYYWPAVGGQEDIQLLSDVRPVSAKTTVLPGTWNYDVATLATLRDSLSLINITLSKRIVPIGDTVTIDVDAQNLLLNLSERGVNAKTRIRLYAPQSLDSHVSLRDNTTEEKSIFEAATQAIALHDYTGDGVKDVVVITTDGGVYVLNGKNGYKVPGLSARLTSGSAAGKITSVKVAYLEVPDVAKTRAYLVLGSEPTNTGFNLHVLDPAFQIMWQSRVSRVGAGGQTLVSLDTIPDLNSDGWHEIAVGDLAGTWFYVGGADGITLNYGDAIGTPPATGALVAYGKYGLGPVNGITATTGITFEALNGFDLDESTLPQGFYGAVHNAKKVSFSLADGGLVALDGDLNRLWNYAGALDLYRTVDLDNWGATDIVAGDSEGSVVALNGTQAALPHAGITYTTGTKILDAATLPDDPYRVWTIGADGFLMFTEDGWTTRSYATDAAGSNSLIATPQARALHMASIDVGYAVGDAGAIWITTDGSDDGTVDGVPARWSPISITPPGRTDQALWNLRDVWALDASTVIVVGKCTGCSGPVAFRLAGGSWSTMIGPFTASDAFTRLHFLPDGVTGFAATEAGVVYRTTNGGITWANLGLSAVGQINGLWFTTATDGWVVGNAGTMHRVDYDGISWKTTLMTLGIGSNLQDISFADSSNGLTVGDGGVILRTHDGGSTWVRLSGSATSDYTRAPYPIKSQGYVVGSGPGGSERYVGIVATYSTSSIAYSDTDLEPPESARWITLYPTTRNLDGYTDVRYSVSPDGGFTWYPVTKYEPLTPDVLNNVPYHPVKVEATPGTDIRVKMELKTDSRFPYVSPEVENVYMVVSYGAANDTVLLNTRFGTDQAPGAGSSAVYDPVRKALRSPRIEPFWNQKLGGPIVAIDVGRAITTAGHSDLRTDVLVGTGGTDRRVVALSGTSGARLWTSPQLDGAVRAVAFADLPGLTGDGAVDVIAVVDAPPDPLRCPTGTVAATKVYFLDGRTGLRLPADNAPSPYLICGPWKGFAVADLSSDGNTDGIVGQSGQVGGEAGYVTAVDGKSTKRIWRTVPSIKGLYTTEFTAPLSSLFGPYVVEVEVTGTQTLPDETQLDIVTRAVTYFLVTPPDGKMPVSPVYTVEVVVWYDDWDFAPGATNTQQLPALPSNPSWRISTHSWVREYNFN